jgi:hypothetical protein
MFICLMPGTPFPPPPYTLYRCILYTYSHREGGGGGRVEPERRLEGQQFAKLGQKSQHDYLYLQSIKSDKHQPQSPFTGHFL